MKERLVICNEEDTDTTILKFALNPEEEEEMSEGVVEEESSSS